MTAFPPANITWFKDGQRVEQVLNSSDFQLVNDGRELVFSELEDEYSGVYVCEADNVLGNSSISMVLDVQRELKKHVQLMHFLLHLYVKLYSVVKFEFKIHMHVPIFVLFTTISLFLLLKDDHSLEPLQGI